MPDAPPARHAWGNQPDERADLERRMQEHIDFLMQESIARLHALTARDQHLANVRGALLGVAISTVGLAIEEGWILGVDITIDAINRTLGERGLPWLLIRPH